MRCGNLLSIKLLTHSFAILLFASPHSHAATSVSEFRIDRLIQSPDEQNSITVKFDPAAPITENSSTITLRSSDGRLLSFGLLETGTLGTVRADLDLVEGIYELVSLSLDIDGAELLFDEELSTLSSQSTVYVTEIDCGQDVWLRSQEDVNQFRDEYRSCASFNGSITVEEADNGSITSIAPLSFLNHVHGKLAVIDNDSLPDLFGLNNVLSAHYLEVSGNGSLADATALGAVYAIRSGMTVQVDGPQTLQSLVRVGSYCYFFSRSEVLTGPDKLEECAYFTVDLNSRLASLQGFRGLKNVRSLRIGQNDLLESIEGFDSLETVDSSFSIDRNPNLRTIVGFNNLTRVDEGDLEVYTSRDLIEFSAFKALQRVGGDLDLSQIRGITELLEPFAEVTEVGGLVIPPPSLSNLNIFNKLKTAGGVRFFSQPATDLSGFNSLSNLDYLSIARMPNLTTVSGFEELSSINSLSIDGNNSLTSLTTGGRYFSVSEGFYLVDNPNLESLLSLAFASQMSSVTIRNNAQLIDIDRMRHIESVANSIQVNNNQQLDDCTALLAVLNWRIDVGEFGPGNYGSNSRVRANSDNCASVTAIEQSLPSPVPPMVTDVSVTFDRAVVKIEEGTTNLANFPILSNNVYCEISNELAPVEGQESNINAVYRLPLDDSYPNSRTQLFLEIDLEAIDPRGIEISIVINENTTYLISAGDASESLIEIKLPDEIIEQYEASGQEPTLVVTSTVGESVERVIVMLKSQAVGDLNEGAQAFTVGPLAIGSGYSCVAEGVSKLGNLRSSAYDAFDITEQDTDGDGVGNTDDAFPLDPSESLDTDGDGVGNNADDDDDGDGYSDSYEVSSGTDPLDKNSFPSSSATEDYSVPIWLYFIVTQGNDS